MKFYFIAIVGSLSSFTFHRSMVDGKFIGIVFGVMAFVHESHESRFMISVGVLTKEPNQRVLDAVTPKIVADLSLCLFDFCLV